MTKLLGKLVVAALCGAFACAGSQAASAQNWAGLYAGINLGGAWADSSIGAGGLNGGAYTTAYFNQVLGSGVGSASDSTFTIGGQLGYNVQSANIVYGVEGDLNWLNTSMTRTVGGLPPGSGNPFTITDTVSTTWLATLRARAGFTAGNVLYYVTGGLAFTDISLWHSYRDSVAPVLAEGVSVSETKTGWVIGGGAEIGLGGNWSLKGEYLYMDFGTVAGAGVLQNTVTGGSASIPPTVFGHSADLTVQTVRAGINYRF